MKRTLRAILALCLLLSLLTLTGCGFFGAATLEIVDMRVEEQADGSSLLIVEFADESKLEAVIPKRGEPGADGAPGATGNGIQEIKVTQTEKETQVEVFYTDGTSLEPFSIPNGVSVAEIWPDEDEIGKYFFLEYSDGTYSKNLYLPSGKDGNEIVKIDTIPNSDDSRTVQILMKHGDPYEFIVPAPLQGVGIATVIGKENGSKYELIITNTDGVELEPIAFSRPNGWYSSAIGKMANFGTEQEGDFLYDTTKNIIYVYKDGGWDEVISFAAAEGTHTVTFNPNESGLTYEKVVAHGSYLSDIPVFTKDGYKFLGWYTKPTLDPADSATMSPFTDLTPVLADLTLYAIYEPLTPVTP